MTTAHLDFIRSLPCCACGDDSAMSDRHVHHLIGGRYSQKRADDSRVVPLCQSCHQGVGGLHTDGNEERWAADVGVDLRWLAGAIWAASGDYEAARAAIAMARGR